MWGTRSGVFLLYKGRGRFGPFPSGWQERGTAQDQVPGAPVPLETHIPEAETDASLPDVSDSNRELCGLLP